MGLSGKREMPDFMVPVITMALVVLALFLVAEFTSFGKPEGPSLGPPIGSSAKITFGKAVCDDWGKLQPTEQRRLKQLLKYYSGPVRILRHGYTTPEVPGVSIDGHTCAVNMDLGAPPVPIVASPGVLHSP